MGMFKRETRVNEHKESLDREERCRVDKTM